MNYQFMVNTAFPPPYCSPHWSAQAIFACTHCVSEEYDTVIHLDVATRHISPVFCFACVGRCLVLPSPPRIIFPVRIFEGLDSPFQGSSGMATSLISVTLWFIRSPSPWLTLNTTKRHNRQSHAQLHWR